MNGIQTNKRPASERRGAIEEKTYQMLIGGRWQEALSENRFQRRSPAHDAVVGSYPLADAADVDLTVATARRAFNEGPWPRTSGAERATLLLKVAQAIRDDKEALARTETLESGKPVAQARDEMEATAALWEYAAALARTLHGDSYNTLGADMLGFTLRDPVGVVGLITPWNFPLLIVSQKLPFALAAGCTAVLKPSELTPGTALRLGEMLLELGLPEGVVNIVTGYGDSAGRRLAEHPDVDALSFTGSTEVGKQIVRASHGNLKRVSLELGGKNPQIIFPDADFGAALDAVTFAAYFNMGECCNSGSRVLVHREVREAFTEALLERAKVITVGDPLDEETLIGAIVDEAQFQKIMDYVEVGQQEGAELRLGGARLSEHEGLFLPPTIFDKVTPAMRIASEEIFGPVLTVLPFETEEEAVHIANGTPYGLSAGVWTKDVGVALRMSRRIRAGKVWVNTFLRDYPELPFGGFKQSGSGRELGRSAVEEFTELKTVQVQLEPGEIGWFKKG